MLILPPEIMTILTPFKQVFSARVWDWAQVLLVGAILAPGKRTVTSALRVLGLKDEQQYQNYHRVLNRAKWSGLQVSQILLGLLVTVFVGAGMPIVLGAGETLARRRGQKIKARGISNCHTTQEWQTISFSHASLVDCLACHGDEQPDNHYAGQCSACHDTDNWGNITFSHAGLTDCLACHSDEKPADHWAGQCSNCHNTVDWSQVTFSQNGFSDCQSCHAAPPDHWPDPCFSCHNVLDWKQIIFNHDGFTDCQSCHTAPADHWPGQCSDCHTTVDWNTPLVNHNPGADCVSCHMTEDWFDYTFDHTSYTDVGMAPLMPAAAPPPASDKKTRAKKEYSGMQNWYDLIQPNEDIRKENFDEAVFAADIGDVAIGKAPADYNDPYLFYKKTYLTAGLKGLLHKAQERLVNGSGASVVQIKTPYFAQRSQPGQDQHSPGFPDPYRPGVRRRDRFGHRRARS